MSSEAQKKQGYPNKANPETTETQDFCITIPAGVEYRNALYAQLVDLGKWWNWQREDTGEKAKLSAETWRSLFLVEEDCGEPPMTCEDVETCLESSTIISDLNDSIDTVAGDVGAGTSGYKPSSPTKPLNQSSKYAKFSGDIVEPDGSCDDDDKDKLWAVIKSLVISSHLQNSALLTSVYNNVDLASAVAKLSENVPLAAALEILDAINLVDDILLTFKTNYDSAVTEAFLYDVMEDLFCAATDCEFSFEDFASYIYGQAGGTFDAAATTILDIFANLFGQSTGAGVYYALTALQISALGLGEKFSTQQTIDGMILAAKTAPPDSQWRAYATECETHTGAWTLILDFAGDYVKVGSEFIYNMPLSRWAFISGNNTLVTQRYKTGYVYSEAGSGFTNKRLTVLNSGAQFQDARIYWRRSAGPATAQITVISNLYTPPANTTTSASFFLDTFKALRGVGSPVGSISYLQVQWNQNLSSQAVASEIKYIEIRGTGELPIFA